MAHCSPSTIVDKRKPVSLSIIVSEGTPPHPHPTEQKVWISTPAYRKSQLDAQFVMFNFISLFVKCLIIRMEFSCVVWVRPSFLNGSFQSHLLVSTSSTTTTTTTIHPGMNFLLLAKDGKPIPFDSTNNLTSQFGLISATIRLSYFILSHIYKSLPNFPH